jgi:hypothetical protein
MTKKDKIYLKKKISELVINHWGKYYTSKLKKDLIAGKKNSWVHNGASIETLLWSALSRSYDSSLGNLYEKILVILSEYYNDKTYGKLKNLKLHSNGKVWIIDLGFKRNDVDYLIELKLGGELDNKKAKSEASALKERKDVLIESKLADKVETYLGIITLSKGEETPKEWKMGRVKLGFDRNQVLVERELFDFVSNDTDVFDFIKDKIQPFIMNEWNIVLKKIKSKYL